MKNGDREEAQFKDRVVVLAFVGVAAWAIAVGCYALWFSTHGMSAADKWGQFGDFLGGVVNPIIGLATVILIAISLLTQREELRATQRELKDSNRATSRMAFEQSFFAWLNSYHRLLDSVSITDSNLNGRAALVHWQKTAFSIGAIGRLVYGYPRDVIGDITPYLREALDESIKRIDDPVEERLVQEVFRLTIANYSDVYAQNRSDLDALFRTIFRLLKWIDDSDMNAEEKWHYVAIVRAQVSWIESYYLLLNCLTARGRHFCRYANTYSFFDNLEAGPEPVITVISKIYSTSTAKFAPLPDQGWPLEPRAFSSDLGRAAVGIKEE